MITRRGKPVANLVPIEKPSPCGLTPEDILAIRKITAGDPTLAADLKRLCGGTMDELGPIR